MVSVSFPQTQPLSSAQGLSFGFLRRLARNPMDALPPEVFDHALVTGWGPLGRGLHVLDPDLIQDVLVRKAESFGKPPSNRRVLGPTLGDGLLTAEGAHWRWQRRATAPSFQPAKVSTFAPAMLAAARDTRDRWLATSGTPLQLNHETMQTTFAIILATMLSGPAAIDPARFEQASAETLSTIGFSLAISLLNLPAWTPYPGRRRTRRASADLRDMVGRLVASHRRADAQGTPDLLTYLEAATDPESGRTLDDTALVDNLLTFIAAGHETTALGLAWTLHLLESHPAVEAKVVDEIASVTGGAEVTPAHLDQLVYLRQVFSEAMRLFPPAPMIARQARAPLELGGIALKPNDIVIVPIYALHRNSLVWPDPARFDPDRFLLEAVAARHRFAFMPFGGGPRVCIGMGFAMLEAVAILAVLLQKLRVRALPGARPPTPVMRVTLKPMPDFSVVAEGR